MIGIKVQNFIWEKALLSLLKEQAEIWQEKQIYQAVLVQLPPNELKLFQKKEKAPLIKLGDTISLPFKYTQLIQQINSIPDTYENATFQWDKTLHLLKNKKNRKQIPLTEKENELLSFLKKAPHQIATKKMLLEHVWQYMTGTDTHTVETTLFALRKKLAPYSDALIISKNDSYHLV